MLLALIGCLVAATIVYMAVKLTISVIKKFRKRKNTKVVMADMGELMKKAAKDPNVSRASFDALDEIDGQTVVAEYDEETDEIVQCEVAREQDSKIDGFMKSNNGLVILED